MNKARKLADTMCQEYSASAAHGPRILPEIKVISMSDKECDAGGFSADRACRSISLKASDPFAATAACAQILTGVNSGHLAEVLGRQRPLFPQRLLWIGSQQILTLNERVQIAIPAFFERVATSALDLDTVCRRIVEWGYSGIIIGACPGVSVARAGARPPCDLRDILSHFRAFGLSVMIKPQVGVTGVFSPFDARCRQQVSESLRSCVSETLGDGIVWESRWSEEMLVKDRAAREMTHYDWIREEIATVEAAIDSRVNLIYAVTTASMAQGQRQAKWLHQLLDDVSPRTTVAFSAVAGPAHADHLPLHPYWHELRGSPDTSSTPLLPIVNTGAIRMGEGLWPTPCFENVAQTVCRMYRHPFAGTINLVNHLPMPGSMLDWNLWVAGQTLWTGKAPQLLAETWLASHGSQLASAQDIPLLMTVRHVADEIAAIREAGAAKGATGELWRVKGERLFAHLRELQAMSHDLRPAVSAKNGPTLRDYLIYFVYTYHDD